MFSIVFCLCKLIEEQGGARNVKFGTRVFNNDSRREFEDLSEMSHLAEINTRQ